MKTIFELKQDMTTIGNQIQKTKDEISQKAADPAVSVDDLNQLNKTSAELQQRFDIIKAQHDQMEAEQKASLEKSNFTVTEDPKQKVVDAKAEIIRATMGNRQIKEDVFQALGDDGTSKGGKFLPSTMTNDIIAEPLVKNQLRENEVVTQITNLTIPRISFMLDDDDFIEDMETAKEMKAKGDSVTFGRFKTKVKAGVSETILHGTNTNLVSHVENNLRSGLAAKERKVSFATAPKAGEEHMSFYDKTTVNVKEVTGDDLYDAITKALADLHEDYRENAKIYMTFADYVSIIKTLSNGTTNLYSAQPEQILGKPVVFTDAAITPVIGDFSYAQLNYDISDVLYEQYKDYDKGINYFMVTAWFDHQIKLASAFRLAKKA
ncbi:phage major capsid protein [Enterococcus hulanensis]|uniref:Phage major capsid protein n=1 Tax=Enterococcus hulanensis TaxID=2559929 RepID=A0ABU3EXT8_9ENTE|nr:phage major capsid protein [Enterococcus hulanensis]MDT2599481.1 phage major capsid protein [Enterococcus hulanensis]MDT2608888.1 phage major capsid protein [Enterococcus hulanensis]MDT2616643.1 phage major capsid protein [Enterococcus hulanensis]MDT2627317.1 phage major capsid protein [Enterococcus hulanensis]MDT2658176.1 phage major capsid protein [Enterococcus hulanensis]